MHKRSQSSTVVYLLRGGRSMPKLFASRSGWVWAGRIILAVCLGLMALMSWQGGVRTIDLLPFPVWLFPTLHLIIQGQYSGAFVLLDGVLALPGNGINVQYVPLAVAEAKQSWLGWAFRWKEGRGNQAARAFVPLAGRGPLAEAIAAAKAADPKTQAQTAKEAAARLRVTVLPQRPRWLLAWMVVLIAALVAGLWLRNPIPFGLAALMALFLPLDAYPPVLAWAGESLWMLSEKAEPYAIPLEKITETRTSRAKGTRILTSDPVYPAIQIAAFQDDFVKALERRLAGEPEPAPAGPSSEPLLRCALCGAPAPGHHPAVGTGVFICEMCSNRARLEATESGHGMTPKEPKPM